MSENKTSNITIDDLAVILSKQFDSINKQFNNVNGQLKELKQGHENIELKLTDVAYRFELQELQGVVKNLQKQVVLLNAKVGMKMDG